MAGTTLDRVGGLVSLIAERSLEIEEARRVPLDLVDQLRAAGCFRMLVPEHKGGDEMRLDEALAVIEALSRADSAVGWVVMIGASATPIFAHFPPATFDDIYCDGPDVIGAGSLQPKGTAVEVDGGYRLTGQWPFASGCEHADWILVHTPVSDGLRMMLLRPDEVEIVDTWHVLGLRGTGSHDIRLDGTFCPIERSAALFGATPTIDIPALRVPLVSQLGLFVASVALGIAQGALDDVAAVASGGKRAAMTGAPLARSTIFQDSLGGADLTLGAARALLFGATRDASEMAERGPLPVLERARLRSTGGKVAELCMSVVDTAHRLAGSAGVYDPSPLPRRLRDIHTLAEHAAATREFYPIVGALLAGEEVPTSRI